MNLVGSEIGIWNSQKSVFWTSIARAFFLEDAKLTWLISGISLVFFASLWLILSPGVIYSRAMTWDLLFILEGAWRLYTGQVLHVDFHYPIGALPLSITALGFYLVGVKPIAFLVGEYVLAAVFTVLAVVVVKDRLPALPGFLFVSTCTLLVLVPVDTGHVDTYTFAMGYDRFGWSAVSILFLLLFVEPRRRDPVWHWPLMFLTSSRDRERCAYTAGADRRGRPRDRRCAIDLGLLPGLDETGNRLSAAVLAVIFAALLALTMVGGTVAVSAVTSEPGALPVVLANAMISRTSYCPIFAS
jgi:hypothetical protein